MRLLMFICALVFIGIFAWRMVRYSVIKSNMEDSYRYGDQKKVTIKIEKWPFVCLAFGVVLLIACISLVIVKPSHTGILVRGGENKGRLQHTRNWTIPFLDEVEIVDNRYRVVEIPQQLWCESSEQTPVYYAETRVTFYIPSDSSEWVYFNVPNYEKNLIESTLVATALKSSSKTFNNVDVTNRSLIGPKTLTALQSLADQKFGEGTIVIVAIDIGDADFEPAYNEAIAKKNEAIMGLETAEADSKKQIIEAEARNKAAKIDAETAIVTAQGQKDANDILVQSLTPEILQKQYLEKWDGKLPLYMGSGTENVILDFEK